MSVLQRAGYTTNHLGNTQGVDPLADNSTNDISAEDLRNALSDLRDSAAFRKTDAYVRFSTTTSTTSNVITITLSDDYPASYNTNIPVAFKADATSTGDFSVKINSLSALPAYTVNQRRLTTNDIVINEYYEGVYSTDADGGGTAGFVVYQGLDIVAPPIEITGTTYTIGAVGTYVFTGSSACSISLPAGNDDYYKASKIINAGTANCTVNPNGAESIINSDPFVVFQGTAYDFLYTGISGKEWSFI